MKTQHIETYLNQLKNIAKQTGWKLLDGCIDAGVSNSTYYRWVRGTSSPRIHQATKVAEYMLKYSRN